MTLNTSEPAAGGPLVLCRAPLPDTDGLRGELVALTAPPHPAALLDRRGLFMVSIKNRQFTTGLIDGFCRFATTRLRGGGDYTAELPRVSALARARPHLVYADIRC